MRRLAAVFLTLVLGGCGGGDQQEAREPVAPPTPAPATESVTKGVTLSCGRSKVRVPDLPPNLERAGSFARLPALARPLKVRGALWQDGAEQLRVGVVCGVRGAEQFATLVARSRLTAYRGKPALRWNSRGGLRNYMWLERPGTAVYIAATPALASQVRGIAAGIGRPAG
ncbi:hypothetical protein [Nonomuraea pusilla]|uniref:Lipoprotein n=1 Tax=Nonomuraea pusilla TaxID=46177 RepID=A0A1H8GIQ7_9ACTN|nr:hypothetical protein [Nonomuraea pusilla]SEN43689.1 hypothetical protein SAMN05660976_07575 [Nonomuraea pusilla]